MLEAYLHCQFTALHFLFLVLQAAKGWRELVDYIQNFHHQPGAAGLMQDALAWAAILIQDDYGWADLLFFLL